MIGGNLEDTKFPAVGREEKSGIVDAGGAKSVDQKPLGKAEMLWTGTVDVAMATSSLDTRRDQLLLAGEWKGVARSCIAELRNLRWQW